MLLQSPELDECPAAPKVEAFRARTASGGLDALVERVRAVRPRLIDGWEATALVESLGYTDSRVAREFGVGDMRELGELVYWRSREQGVPLASWRPANLQSPLAIVVRSAASTLVYAVPWLCLFVGQIVRPDALRLPGTMAPALALALMFSLVASGGFVQVIVRRGEFYAGLRQAAMARQVARGLLRIGVLTILTLALAAVVTGWYYELFAWPSLVLAADAFVVMSILWMVCGVFAVRQQQWRVALAFAAGFAAFAVVRRGGADVLTAQLAAVAVVLAAGAAQIGRVFGSDEDPTDLAPGVSMPRLSVLVYWTLPYFWYGTVYFGFLFADRVAAGTATVALSGSAFGIPAQYGLGMELALLTLLLAASGVEVAGALFARAFTREAVHPIQGGGRLARALHRHHRRAMTLAIVTYAAAGVVVAVAAQLLLRDRLTPAAWITFLAGAAGYAALAVGLVNALILFETRGAWTVVRHFTAALAINLGCGYALGHVFGTIHAVDGLLAGGIYLAVASTGAVRRTLARPDYAYAIA